MAWAIFSMLFLAIGGVVYGAAALIWFALTILANWLMFRKAGEAGWKSIIPVYNTYTAYKIAWTPEYVLDLFHIYSVGKYIFQYFRRRFLVVFGISGRSVRTGNDRFVCVLLCESGEKLRKRTWVYDRTDFP